ncbi:hypothetical protein B0H11DRAFT_1957202 [Mycena galericulata]|nr:hypothetical protein B0H11DRAFT_1957202 [Mycena galericulata]
MLHSQSRRTTAMHLRILKLLLVSFAYLPGAVAPISSGPGVCYPTGLLAGSNTPNCPNSCCAPGYTFNTYNAGAASCTTCPANTFSGSGASGCTACPASSTSNPVCLPRFSIFPLNAALSQGSSQCTQHCPAGQFINGYSCATCTAGTYSGADATSCTPCSTNTFSDAGASICSNCAAGYTSDPGSSTCNAPGPAPSGSSHSPRSWLEQEVLTCALRAGYMMCPVMTGTRRSECVDVKTSLESCGGCAGSGLLSTQPRGRDCSAISHVDAVRCVEGRCKVLNCRPNYEVSVGGDSCVPAVKTSPLHHSLR